MNQHSLAAENWEYYLGNHHQLFLDFHQRKNPPWSEQIKAELKRVFRSYNVCGQIVAHYVNSLVGKPFNWQIKDASGKINPEAENIFSLWLEWQNQAALDLNLGKPIEMAVTQMLVCDQGKGAGVGYLRIYLPETYQNLEPYQGLIVDVLSPGTVEVERNLEGILEGASYRDETGKQEDYQLRVNGLTRISDPKNQSFKDLDLKGRLPLVELKGKVLIDHGVKEGQRSICQSLIAKSLYWENFALGQMLVLNGQLLDQDSLNSTTYIGGIPQGDLCRPQGYTNPRILKLESNKLKNYDHSLKLDLNAIYHQVGLAYLTPNNISASSRALLRDDFLLRLKRYQKIVEGGLKRVFSVVIDFLAQDYPVLQGCKPTIKLNLSLSPSLYERDEDLQDVRTRVLSPPTAIARRGGDVPTELELIAQYSHILRRLR